jgi:hypothetical protein
LFDEIQDRRSWLDANGGTLPPKGIVLSDQGNYVVDEAAGSRWNCTTFTIASFVMSG